MKIDELAKEYETQAKNIQKKIDFLKPLQFIYSGEDLVSLRKKLKIYDDMYVECIRIAMLLKGYCNE